MLLNRGFYLTAVTVVLPHGWQGFLEAQAVNATTTRIDRIIFFIRSYYTIFTKEVKYFLGCSKGIEPSPSESQSEMLTLTPQATLFGSEVFCSRNCHFFNEFWHGARYIVTACVIIMILS